MVAEEGPLQPLQPQSLQCLGQWSTAWASRIPRNQGRAGGAVPGGGWAQGRPVQDLDPRWGGRLGSEPTPPRGRSRWALGGLGQQWGALPTHLKEPVGGAHLPPAWPPAGCSELSPKGKGLRGRNCQAPPPALRARSACTGLSHRGAGPPLPQCPPSPLFLPSPFSLPLRG